MTTSWQRQYNSRRRRLNAQLCENTGTHMLDSGGAAGRMWQRNALRPPKDRPAEWVTFEAFGGRLSAQVIKNTLDVLCDWLRDGERATKARRSWARFLRAEARREAKAKAAGEYYDVRSWGQLLEEWVERTGCTASGGCNTYNEENNLSQDFQWEDIEDPDGYGLVVLRTHNGADARGGYSAPTFWEPSEEWPDILNDDEWEIDGHPVSADCAAVEWEALWEGNEPPDRLTPEQLAEDVGLCIFAKGILYSGEGKRTPLDVLTRIWDECGLTDYAASPRAGAAFVVITARDRAVGTVLANNGAWHDGELRA